MCPSVLEGLFVFSPAIELRAPWIFGRGTSAMASVFVAVVDLLMVHVDLSSCRNRYKTSAKVDGIVLQLVLLLLNGRWWIRRIVMGRWWLLVIGNGDWVMC